MGSEDFEAVPSSSYEYKPLVNLTDDIFHWLALISRLGEDHQRKLSKKDSVMVASVTHLKSYSGEGVRPYPACIPTAPPGAAARGMAPVPSPERQKQVWDTAGGAHKPWKLLHPAGHPGSYTASGEAALAAPLLSTLSYRTGEILCTHISPTTPFLPTLGWNFPAVLCLRHSVPVLTSGAAGLKNQLCPCPAAWR